MSGKCRAGLSGESPGREVYRFTREHHKRLLDKKLRDEALSRLFTETIVGTPPYMAPEMEQGFVRRESDVYALAVCAYEMLTGSMPFPGQGAGLLLNKMKGDPIPAASWAIVGLPAALDFLAALEEIEV